MMSENFSQQEAESLVGREFETRIELAGVPVGTRGRAVSAVPVGGDWNVVLQWELPGTAQPQRGFDKAEIEQYLRPVA